MLFYKEDRCLLSFALIPFAMFKHVMLEKRISSLRIRYSFEEIFCVTDLYIYILFT